MALKELDLIDQLRPTSIGFDSMFNHIDSVLKSGITTHGGSYPPYNIIRNEDDTYVVEMAVAGIPRDAMSVSLTDGVLTIAGETQDEDTREGKVLYRGIAQRKFSRQFRLASHVEVVGATLEDGLLKVTLRRLIPEEAGPRQIEIK